MSPNAQAAAHVRRARPAGHASRRAPRPAGAAAGHAAPVPDGAVISAPTRQFDAYDYNVLKERYLHVRVRENEQLPEGIVLRRKTAPAVIDQAQYAKLKKKIGGLQRSGNDVEIYRLLCELRAFEMNGRHPPEFLLTDDQIGGSLEVVEEIDLSANEAQAIDVEALADNDSAAFPDQVSSIPMSYDPLPEKVPSVTSVLQTAQHQASVAQEVVDLLDSSDDDDDNDNDVMNMKVKAWSRAEDDILCEVVGTYLSTDARDIDWGTVANRVGSQRTHLQCLERYDKLSRNPAKTRARQRASTSLPALPMPTIEDAPSKRKPYQETNFDSSAPVPAPAAGGAAATVFPPHAGTNTGSFSANAEHSDNSQTTLSTVEMASADTTAATDTTLTPPRSNVLHVTARESSDVVTRTSSITSFGSATTGEDIQTPTDNSATSAAMASPKEEVISDGASSAPEDHASLKAAWNKQTSERLKGIWKPTGGWKAPAWANQTVSAIKNEEEEGSAAVPIGQNQTDAGEQKAAKKPKTSHVSCSKMLLAHSSSLLINSVPLTQMQGVSVAKNLSELKYNRYLEVTEDLLANAHRAQMDLLPNGDCDSWDVVKLARSYYSYWRPAKGNVKAILLAESHSFTETERATLTCLDPELCPEYHGPRNFIQLVHCLAYGEKSALKYFGDVSDEDGAALAESLTNAQNSGSAQFWTLFAAAARGVDYVPNNVAEKNLGKAKHSFAIDVLKAGKLKVEDRLKAKTAILEELKERGIWLLDVSVTGWYISQPQQYKRSKKTNEVHRMAKERPPKEMKAPSMVLSWELFTKHVIREAAEEGALELLVPIGQELTQFLGMERLAEAVTPTSTAAGTSPPAACKIESIPAPNAWIPGGYGPFYAKVATLMDEYAPRQWSSI